MLNAILAAQRSESAAPLFLTVVLAYLAAVDIKYRRIPNFIVFPAAAVGLVLSYFFGDITRALVGGAVVGGVFLAVYIIERGRLGAGDVKLSLLMGICLGLNDALMALLIAMLLYLVIYVALRLMKKIPADGSLPLAPFAFAGTIIFLLSR